MSYETQQQNEAVKPTKIDLNDPTAVLPDDELIMDSEADAFAGPAPVPDGTHLAKLALGQRGFQTGRTSTGNAYVMAHIEGRIVAEGESFDNFPVFDSVSSLVFDNGTSKMAGVLKATGETIPSRTTLKDFANAFGTVLAGNPLVKITTRWEAYCKECPGKAGKTGKVVLRGMKKFPQLDSGAYRHTIDCPECGTPLSAQAKPVKYSPRG